MLQHAVLLFRWLLIGCSCAIEHEGLWLAEFQTLRDAIPSWLRDTSVFILGEVSTPQTQTIAHATNPFPLNPPVSQANAEPRLQAAVQDGLWRRERDLALRQWPQKVLTSWHASARMQREASGPLVHA